MRWRCSTPCWRVTFPILIPGDAMSFRLTYASMYNPPSELHERFEAALASVRAGLGQRHALYIDGADRHAERQVERHSPIDAALAARAASRWRAPPTSTRRCAPRRRPSRLAGDAGRRAPAPGAPGRRDSWKSASTSIARRAERWRSARTAWRRSAKRRRRPSSSGLRRRVRAQQRLRPPAAGRSARRRGLAQPQRDEDPTASGR